MYYDFYLRYTWRRTERITVILWLCILVLSCGSAWAQESRYEQWQKGRPFTIGAMFYDYHEYREARGAEAQIPAPEGAFPDMNLVRQAGLNLISDVSHSNGGHKNYPGVSSVQEAGGSFMILGAGWGPTPLENFQSHVRMFADDPRWTGFCGVQLADEPHHDPEDPGRCEHVCGSNLVSHGGRGLGCGVSLTPSH